MGDEMRTEAYCDELEGKLAELEKERDWLDERIEVVRGIIAQERRGELDPHTALATISQQLLGVARTTPAKPDP